MKNSGLIGSLENKKGMVEIRRAIGRFWVIEGSEYWLVFKR